MRFGSSLALAIAFSSVVHAEDWPQFLGPRRDGTSTDIIKPWKTDPRVGWKVTVGDGHSSPVVSEGRVFLHDRVPGKDAERLSVFDAKNGAPLTAIEYQRGPFANPFGVGPRATPTVMGNQILTLGVTGHLGFFALEKTDSESKFMSQANINLLDEYKLKNLTFGPSASPLVEGDLAIVQAGGELQAGPKGKGAGILAFNRDTRKPAWTATDDPASYASPMAIGEGKNRQIIVLTQKGLVSVSPKDGKVFWQYSFQDALNESSTTPVLVGDLLIASSVTRGSVALKLIEKDGKPGVEEAWKKPELNCYFSTPVAANKDHLYMVTGVLAARPSITLRCVETATGKTLWSRANIGKYHAALVKTGDDKLLMLDDAGRLVLLQPNAKQYQELCRSKVCGDTWAHPAVSNGRIYLRDAKELICLELEK